MSFFQRLVLSIRSRCGNASKRQRIRVIYSLGLLILLMVWIMNVRTDSSSNNGTTGDANLTYLKTNPELTQKLVKLAAAASTEKKQPSDNYATSSLLIAGKESGGFFASMDDAQFQMLKEKAHAVQPNTRGNPLVRDGYSEQPHVWFQNHYEPELSCPFERRIGRLGDGGKWVCNPHFITSSSPKHDCLVYSVGSNGDASFEAAILRDVSPECHVHVFDFGNYESSVLVQTNHDPHVHYHQWGISDATSGVFKTLQDTVQELGHVGRTVDIFKIDCEGCELDTFASWFRADVTLKQILVEIHPRMTATLSLSPWKSTVRLPETVNFFTTLHEKGYVITHKEPNIQYQGNGICVEYNFLLLSPEFWQSNKES